jgi:hypothetical protein
VNPRQAVRFEALEAIAWNNNGKAGGRAGNLVRSFMCICEDNSVRRIGRLFLVES